MKAIQMLEKCIRLGAHLHIDAEGLGECIFTAHLTFIGKEGFNATSNHSLAHCLDCLTYKVEQDGVLDRLSGKQKPAA